MPLPPRPVTERFWEKVRKSDTCWEWQAGVGPSGYGLFFLRWENGRSVHTVAHRYSYEEAFGHFDEALCVLHKCDNRRCVRPDHLFLGTRTENAADKVAKGRHESPSAYPNRRLTHCKNGHEFTPENTYRWHGERGCRICRRDHRRSFAKRRRSASEQHQPPTTHSLGAGRTS